ncbi:MAG TPA: NlpC/P60 family protein, partial [Myxococcota bacterium]
SHAVARLHNDIAKLKKAEHARDGDAKALHKDTRNEKHEHNVAVRQHDAFEKSHKALGTARDTLGKARTAEQSKLAPLDAQLGTLQQQYDASIDPVTGQGDPALQAQIDAVTQREAGVHAQMDPKIGVDQQKVAGLQQQVAHHRAAAHAARVDVTSERAAAKKETHALTHEKAVVKSDRMHGKKDLLSAEYKMGLKGTNDARKALGMHAVDHVIRPHQKLNNAVKIAEQAVQLQQRSHAYDYTQDFGARTNYGHGPTTKNGSGRITFDCSGFIGSVYKAAGLPSPYTVGYTGTSFDVAACKNMQKVSEAHAKPGDVVVFPDHIALYLGHGKCISMGQEGDPKVVTVAEEAAYKNRGIQGFYHPKGA